MKITPIERTNERTNENRHAVLFRLILSSSHPIRFHLNFFDSIPFHSIPFDSIRFDSVLCCVGGLSVHHHHPLSIVSLHCHCHDYLISMYICVCVCVCVCVLTISLPPPRCIVVRVIVENLNVHVQLVVVIVVVVVIVFRGCLEGTKEGRRRKCIVRIQHSDSKRPGISALRDRRRDGLRRECFQHRGRQRNLVPISVNRGRCQEQRR